MRDFGLSTINMKDIFNKLNGNIILIRRNHDGKSVKFYEEVGFKVLTHAPIILDEYKLILSHVPVPDNLIKKGYINLHGHIHNKKLNDDYPKKNFSENNHINLSVEVTNYKSVRIEEILELKNKNKN